MPRPSKGDRAPLSIRIPVGLKAIMDNTLPGELNSWVETAIREKLRRDHGIG